MTSRTSSHKNRRSRTASLALLAVLAAGLGSAQPPPPAPPGFEIERTEWLGKTAPGTTVEVVNPFGDVRARFGGYEGVVEVQAVLQHFAEEGPQLRVEPLEGAGGVRVVVGYPSAAGGELSTRRTAGQKKRADLVVFVPQGVGLRTTTEDGLTEIRGLHGDVEARSVSGKLHVRGIKGDLRLTTESGPIVAVPEPLDRTAVQRLSSRSGDVEVYLFEHGNFIFRAATHGLVSTDFSLSIDADAQDAALKRVEATIGKGTTPIEVTGDTGHVRLIRKPSAALARTHEREEGSP